MPGAPSSSTAKKIPENRIGWMFFALLSYLNLSAHTLALPSIKHTLLELEGRRQIFFYFWKKLFQLLYWNFAVLVLLLHNQSLVVMGWVLFLYSKLYSCILTGAKLSSREG